MEMTLNHLKKGQPAVVIEVIQEAEEHWRKLLAFGIVPGSSILILQKFPSLLVQAGHTQVALDKAIAKIVRVRVEG